MEENEAKLQSRSGGNLTWREKVVNVSYCWKELKTMPGAKNNNKNKKNKSSVYSDDRNKVSSNTETTQLKNG